MTESVSRRPRWLWTMVAVVLAVLLLVVASCGPDDDGPGSYDPSSGNHIWYPKRKL